MLRFLIFFISFSFLTARGFAADKGVEVRFLAEAIPDNLGKVVLANAEMRSDPFDLPMNNLSRPQKPPARIFSVWSLDKNLSLANIKLPDEGDAFIVLLLKSSKGGYEPVIIPGGNSSFKAGDVYFYNNSNKLVLGLLGKTQFTLAPGKGAIHTPSGFGDEKFYHVIFGVKEADENKVIKSMKWPSSKTMRNYVFFNSNPETNRITYRAVDEFIAPPTKPADGD